MSSTRFNTAGIFKQEKFTSSPLFERCLKGNLVAARADLLKSSEERALVWFIQGMSMKPGGLRWLATELDYSAEDYIERLSSLALDPARTDALQKLLPAFRLVLADYSRSVRAGFAETAVSKTIWETLDYCAASKCLVQIHGKPRLGKSCAAQQWAKENPGRSRYCEVPADSADISFFTAIARTLGLVIESNIKTKYLQPRIEAALVSGDLVLILDESANLWPANARQLSRPPRISWIMSMMNAGASIALLSAPNFYVAHREFVEKSRWQGAQFFGRLERYVTLDDKLSTADLESVARAWLPYASKRIVETLADAASLSESQHVAAIPHAVKHAAQIARSAGRERVEWADIYKAIHALPTIGDNALADALHSGRRNAPRAVRA